MRIAFDIGGVISKYPEIFRPLMLQLQHAGTEVYIITDMQKRDAILELLRINDFDFVPSTNVYSASYDEHGEACKAVLCEQLQIDMLFDDFIGYTTPQGAAVRLLVMPDCEQPYYADSWKTPESVEQFGRRRYTKRQNKGRDA